MRPTPNASGDLNALGVDETLFCREGPWRRQLWCTLVVAVGGPGRTAQLIDVVPGRSAAATLNCLDGQPEAWKRSICWGVLDLSGPYRKVFNDARQVADPFRLVKLANSKLDECRRRGAERDPRTPRPQERPALPGPSTAHQGTRAVGRPW